MRKLLLFACAASLLFAGCEKDIPLESLAIETSATEIFYDSEAPVLKLVMNPENPTNTDMVWKSSDPDHITVDEAGVLKIVKFEHNQTISIIAEHPASGQTASVVLKMLVKKAKIDDYGILETKGYKFHDPYDSSTELEIKFDILDRNLGATKLYDPAASEEANKASIGDYYQFGNSIPVATVEGVNKYYNKENDGKADDWSKPENTPCPEGWRMATKAELSLLASAMEISDPYYGGDQYPEDVEAAEKFEALMKLPACGQWRIQGDTAADRAANQPDLYLATAKYFWGGILSTGDKEESKRGIRQACSFEYNYFPLGTAGAEVNTARPVRCIRD